jgi:GTP cyclohydrolase II
MALVFGNINSASLCQLEPNDTPEKRERRGAVDAVIEQVDTCLVRVHSCCFTGDIVGSLRCDCGEQLQNSLQIIGKAGLGVIIYLDQEGRGIGLEDKLLYGMLI